MYDLVGSVPPSLTSHRVPEVTQDGIYRFLYYLGDGLVRQLVEANQDKHTERKKGKRELKIKLSLFVFVYNIIVEMEEGEP